MIEVNEQILLERAEVVGQKAKGYQTYVYSLEIFKNKSRAYLSRLKMEIREQMALAKEKITESELETRSLATDSWTNYIDKEMEILKKAGVAKLELEEAVTSYEAMRSALSSRKAEVKSFGG